MSAETVIWHKEPAGSDWNSAYPLGCGRLGAMVFGNIDAERLQLNEDSIWSGGPRDRTNPDALKSLPEIRRLLLAKRPKEAEQLVQDSIAGVPDIMRNYEPLCDLLFQFDYPGKARSFTDEKAVGNDEIVFGRAERKEKAPSGYRRELDLERAVAAVSYSVDGVKFSRELFVSHPAQALVYRIASDKPGSISFRLRIERGPRDNYASRYLDSVRSEGGAGLHVRGATGGEGAIRFAGHLEAKADGAIPRVCGETLIVENANSATLVFAASSSFREADPSEVSRKAARRAIEKGWDALLREHESDHKSLFDRVSLKLGDAKASKKAEKKPLDKRLKAFAKNSEDLALAALYFNFGRYLLIASSRSGSLPANLQGLWNQDFMPAWGSKYTVNINTQMNYWPAEPCNLADCHEPLFEMLKRMLPEGRKTAKAMYGCEGFVCHHNTDVWGDCSPVDRNLSASYWPTGGAWLCLHIWESYLHSLDKEALAGNYELLKESAKFLLGFLVENEAGELVTCPTVSPENTYVLPNGQTGTLCAGTTMDAAICAMLFKAFEGASSVLGKAPKLRDEAAAARAKLPALKIGKHGQIQEWPQDYDELEPGHRHVSHLFALHPGNLIHPDATPDLAKSAKRTLERRLANGGGHTGWSRAWIINFFARLQDAPKAWENLKALLVKCTLPNLFDNHPPFQIDGNFGATAAIVEMLVQSHAGKIELLPALPAEWSEGELRGVRARGAFELSIAWQDGKLVEASILALKGGKATISCAGQVKELTLSKGETRKLDFA